MLLIVLLDIIWLFDPYLRWLSGQPLTGHELSIAGFPDWPINYWGRLGKILQFIAGLTVILDLLDPEKVKERELATQLRLTEARNKLGEFNRKHDIYDLPRRMYDDIVGEPLPETALFPFYYRSLRKIALPPSISQDDWLGLRERIVSKVGGPGTEYISDNEATAVRDKVDTFVDSYLTSEEKDIRRRIQKSRIIAGCLGILACGAVFLYAEHTHNDWLIIALPLIAGAVATYMRVLSLSLWVRLLPALFALRILANVLERTRKPRVLRIVAFILFIIGFQLDLLAS